MRGEAVGGAAEGAVPRPLVLLAVGVVVGPAVLASRQHLAAGSVHRRDAVLVLCGERRHRHAPRHAARLLLCRVAREPGHRRPDRHSGSGSPRFRIRVGL